MPIFVYLLPAVMLFNIGVVPAVLATVVFAPGDQVNQSGDPSGACGDDRSSSTPLALRHFRCLPRYSFPLLYHQLWPGKPVYYVSPFDACYCGDDRASGLGIVYRAITRLEIGSGFEGGGSCNYCHHSGPYCSLWVRSPEKGA